MQKLTLEQDEQMIISLRCPLTAGIKHRVKKFSQLFQIWLEIRNKIDATAVWNMSQIDGFFVVSLEFKTVQNNTVH